MRARRARALGLAAVTLAVAVASLACSRRVFDEEDDTDQADAGASAQQVDAALPRDAADASPPFDARAQEERALLADAGRFCGGKDQPDCPLQAWMKHNATTLLGFGEISSIAEVFDQIALFEPPNAPSDGINLYPHWSSIARDGAAAARMGNLTAAKAACRGCHEQYLRLYHAQLRALPLAPVPALKRP